MGLNMQIGAASDDQKKAVVNRLMSILTSDMIMKLCNLHFYTISYEQNTTTFNGYIIIDQPVHKWVGERKDATIAYIEILPAFRRMHLSRKLIDWVADAAKENNFNALIATCMCPSAVYWVRCGFSLCANKKCKDGSWNGYAVLSLNPMSINNLINKT